MNKENDKNKDKNIENKAQTPSGQQIGGVDKKPANLPRANQTPLAMGLAGFRNSIKARFKEGVRGKSSKSFFVKNTKTITLTGIAPAPLVSKKRIRFIDRPAGSASSSLNYEVYEPKKKARRVNSSSLTPSSVTSGPGAGAGAAIGAGDVAGAAARSVSLYNSTSASASVSNLATSIATSNHNSFLSGSKRLKSAMKKTSSSLATPETSFSQARGAVGYANQDAKSAARTGSGTPFGDNAASAGLFDLDSFFDDGSAGNDGAYPASASTKNTATETGTSQSQSQSQGEGLGLGLGIGLGFGHGLGLDSGPGIDLSPTSTTNNTDVSKNRAEQNGSASTGAGVDAVVGTTAEGADDGVDDGEDGDSKGCLYSIEDQYQITKQSKAEIKAIIDAFSSEQRQRYEVYRRTALSKSAVKKFVSTILNQQVSQTLAFVIAGFGKVFVGEIVELAVAIMDERGDTGPIQPKHLLEAYQRYSQNSSSI